MGDYKMQTVTEKVRYCIWWVICVANFHEKSEKALKIKFCGFKFRDSNQSRGMALHK